MLMNIINTSFDNTFNVITYHFMLRDSLQIFDDELSHYIFEPDFIYTDINYVSRLSSVGKDIVNMLLKIPGVKTFHLKSIPGIDKYVLQVYIEDVFSVDIIQNFINIYNQSTNPQDVYNEIRHFNQMIDDNKLLYKFGTNRSINFYFKRFILKNCVSAMSVILFNNRIVFDYSSRYINQNIIKRQYLNFIKKLYTIYNNRINIDLFRNKIHISFTNSPHTVRERHDILTIARKELNMHDMMRIFNIL